MSGVVVKKDVHEKVMKDIIRPVIAGMEMEGRPYKGFIYAGLMISHGVPRVLEFNVRMGDPETQPLLTRMRTDMVELIDAAVQGQLDQKEVKWDSSASVCVVMTSRGYPGHYQKGYEIIGIEDAENVPGTVVFHSGTALRGGRYMTDGGRVLSVTSLGNGYREALDRAYDAVGKISWDGVHYRNDTGWRALK